MKLLGSIKYEITNNENVENVPHLEINKVVLVYCNIFTKDYLQDPQILYTLVPNNSFGKLLDISPKKFIFLKTFDSEFSYVEVWFTDQNYKPLDKINITLVFD